VEDAAANSVGGGGVSMPADMMLKTSIKNIKIELKNLCMMAELKKAKHLLNVY